ncbi:hypothetical protein FWK35_00016257 [Aphis craccivora]|uniref:Uncharacterized protein n=1 Tax=Aphis craccivora TaxID=307492 RepID=A0A6G0YAA7_APHCR|nr:hypothetical protein FWK35_00016257 [Aphis craccivora]
MLRMEAVDGSQRTEPYSRMGRTKKQKRVFRRESKWKSEETRFMKPSRHRFRVRVVKAVLLTVASPKDSPQATNH